MRMGAVLEQKDPLPGAELQPPLGERDHQLGRQQRALDMRRPVVRPLVVLAIETRLLGKQAAQKGIESVAYLGRGVLLDQQRGRSVRQIDRQQPVGEPLDLEPVRNGGSDLLDFTRFRVEVEPPLYKPHRDFPPRPSIWRSRRRRPSAQPPLSRRSAATSSARLAKRKSQRTCEGGGIVAPQPAAPCRRSIQAECRPSALAGAWS